MESKDLAIIAVLVIGGFLVYKSGLLKIVNAPATVADAASKGSASVIGAASQGTVSVIDAISSGLSGVVNVGSKNTVNALTWLGNAPGYAVKDISDTANNVGQAFTNSINKLSQLSPARSDTPAYNADQTLGQDAFDLAWDTKYGTLYTKDPQPPENANNGGGIAGGYIL